MNAQKSLLAAAVGLVALLGVHAQAGLVGYWDFDGNVADQSPEGNHGTLTGATYDAQVPSAIGGGQSLRFDGDGDYVTVGADSSLNSNVFTLAFFVNQDGAVQSGNYERLTSRGSDTFETALNAGSRISYYPAPGWTTATYGVPRDGWKHVAFVSDGSDMTVYSNGAPVFNNSFAGSPAGILRIGARHNGVEGFEGLMDDAALWDNELGQAEMVALAGGLGRPDTVESLLLTQTTVTSDPSEWARSTDRRSGGPPGTWDLTTHPAEPLPGVGTFTEAAPASPIPGGISAAANVIGVTPFGADGGNGSPEGIQYYRSTFNLDPFVDITASILMAVDNGAQLFINGTPIAAETSFDTANWAPPYSSLTINADGSIGSVTLFDDVAPSFDGWLVGENEIIVAVRNPDTEALNAGGLAFRMDIVTMVPEPATLAIWSLLAGLGIAAAWRKRRT
jgi:hypothetical protein